MVWDERGYPADPLYRDYHAQTVNGMRAWSNRGAAYDHDAAAARAREHAREFVDSVIARADAYRAARGRPALIVCALDTELLGHWWYEGPGWLAEVIAQAGERGIALTTLPAALARRDPVARPLAESSWGREKDLRTWDSPEVADLVWAARQAELALVAALARTRPDALADRSQAARRAARELLALQSSDWSFMTTRDLAGDYPATRVRDHASRFGDAISAVTHGMADFRVMRSPNGHSFGAPDERVRGLAPHLDLAPLLEPGSTWGRYRQ
jgi:1,4-alpha-glucan branching enzyme